MWRLALMWLCDVALSCASSFLHFPLIQHQTVAPFSPPVESPLAVRFMNMLELNDLAVPYSV